MVKSIQELCDKLKKREIRRIKNGKETNGSYILLADTLRDINIQCSCVYRDFIRNQKEFCLGFLFGLFSSHYITAEEFNILQKEVMSAYKAYLQRSVQEAVGRNEMSAEYSDLMSVEEGVAL